MTYYCKDCIHYNICEDSIIYDACNYFETEEQGKIDGLKEALEIVKFHSNNYDGVYHAISEIEETIKHLEEVQNNGNETNDNKRND